MKKRILSGNRPTGKLHIGHLFGVLENWKNLQEKYECFYEIADWHVLTTKTDTSDLQENIMEMAIDWLVVGIDPQKSVIFVQSSVREHAELHLLLSMLITTSRLLRNPTLKEYLQNIEASQITSKKRSFDAFSESVVSRFLEISADISNKSKSDYLALLKSKLKDIFLAELSHHGIVDSDEELTYGNLISYGHLGYPVLQAADILIYRAHFVPIGQDQLPHLEITRELARKFNSVYGEVFPIPEPLLTEFPKILGTDGRKMSKSYDNTILISEEPETLRKKIMSSYTDPEKIRKNDPGHPETCPIYSLHRIFNKEEVEEIGEACKSGALGCVDCKKNLFTKANAYLAPLREKRKEYEKMKETIRDILREGSRKASEETRKTLEIVRDKMKLWKG